MKKEYFIWPESSVFRALISTPRLVTIESVEDVLTDMFPTGHAVLCSSGRAALALALLESGVSRSDFVGTFPYASHCVLDAISRIATPLAGPTSVSAPLRIVYHHWGFVQETNLPPNTIEDCVDTLCLPGCELFPGGGRFEIWSLPKILGTSSGGVLWCRDKKTAKDIREIRDRRGGGLLPWVIRLLANLLPRAHLYWQGAEGDMGSLSRLQTGEIQKAILNWDRIVSDRLKKINMIWPYAIDGLQKPVDRLPSVIPVSLVLTEKNAKDMGMSAGYRMLEIVDNAGSRTLQKVLPIPIHQDVTELWLMKIVECISVEKVTPHDKNV